MKRPDIVLVTPALADANNGNWQTAQRWARLLGPAYRVRLAAQWSRGDEAVLIALHARRSAASVAAWREQRAGAPLLLVLTGTDLYRDIAIDPAAQASLALADRLVVLNELGSQSLPEGLRAKARLVLQSCARRAPVAKTAQHLRAVMVGHLRAEKSPGTYFAAARLLRPRNDILLDHIGRGLDAGLAQEAGALRAECPRYRWLDGRSHSATRAHIQRAHVLVHPSVMEGGAHVVIEALRSGTPVLASRIAGNVGLLGADYGGYFEPGDAAGLAAGLMRLRDEPAMLTRLQQQCAARASLFTPEREAAALKGLLAELLGPRDTP